MSKTLWETTETSTFFLSQTSYNRLCLSTKSLSWRKRKQVECVLRIICWCIVFSEFHDGLHITLDCKKDAFVFCHTWKYLSRSHNWFSFHMFDCNSADSLCICKIRIIPHVCKYVHDSSGTKNQNHTSFFEGIYYVIRWRISTWRNHGIF